MKKIMFVCTGNTCRSAMAECILKKLIKQENLQDIKVSSCGLNVTESAMNTLARKALNLIDVKPRKFVPKQATKKLLATQDVIICMTNSHKQSLTGTENVCTLDEVTGCGEVCDPYGGDLAVYKQTAQTLYEACQKILNILKEVSLL